MSRMLSYVFALVIFSHAFPGSSASVDIDKVLLEVNRKVSGNRARDYTMRLWRYDKWSTLPMWKKTAEEARTIMVERGFDEAEIVNTPADGVTRHSTWTNPIGWDVKQATLEVIEPSGIPDEYRYLCNYLDNPTSLNNYSCPTPPEGIETELVLVENPSPETFGKLDVRGKIILIPGGSRAMKRYYDKHGILGIVSDGIASNNRDFINANQWLNGWSDMPGGWQMNASDSRNNFGFSISQKKANYLRNLLRQGKTVKVRAKIDSRYFTDDYLPYITGCVKGSGAEGEDVLIAGHLFEWGANDNCTGSSAILEAVGVLNDLIREGVLPRPRRTIRVWLGFEMYGSMAYAVHNLERLQNKTIAVVCCDTPAADYDLSTTAFSVAMNFNACPSFTDAIFPEVAARYYSRYSPYKLWKTVPFRTGLDNFFGDPLIGVPINAISMNNGGHLHHNSMDTIEKVDPRTLHDLSVLNAAYLYIMADAGYEDVQWIVQLAYKRGVKVVLDKAAVINKRLLDARDGVALGKALSKGLEELEYYTGLEKSALKSIERIVSSEEEKLVERSISIYVDALDQFHKVIEKKSREIAKEKARKESLKIAKYKKEEGSWEREASTIIPKRNYIGTPTLEGIPVEEWKEVRSSPRWWSSGNWAASSYFWCDGKRNLVEIRKLLELEAGRPVQNFDLIKYYRFLEKFDVVEFVK